MYILQHSYLLDIVQSTGLDNGYTNRSYIYDPFWHTCPRKRPECRLITNRIGLLYSPSIQNHNFDINNSVKFSESPSLFIPIEIWVMIKKNSQYLFSCTALLNCAILSDVVWHDEDPSTIGLNSAANGPQWWCVFISKIFANRLLNTIQEPNVFVKFLKKKHASKIKWYSSEYHSIWYFQI